MDVGRAGYLLAVWVHVTAVVVWVGSMAFLGLVLIPVLRRAGAGESAALLHAAAVRLRVVGWACVALITLTGLYQLPYRGFGIEAWVRGEVWKTPLGRLLAVKLFLVLLTVGASFVHDFYIGPLATSSQREAPHSPQGTRLRRMASVIGRANLILSLVVIGLAVILVRGLP